MLSFKSSSCALLKCLSDALTPFSAAYLATFAFNSSEIVAQLPRFFPADATFSVFLLAARKANAGTAAEELLPASLVDLKKCSSVDVYLQSPRYVSPKTRYEAAKRLPRVEGVCYAMQCLCVAMYVQETSTNG